MGQQNSLKDENTQEIHRKTKQEKTSGGRRIILHKLHMTVGMQFITMPRSPFEQREPVPRLLRIPRQTTSATNVEVMDIGPESAERSTTAVNSELAGDLLCCCVKRQTEIFLR